MVSMGNTKLPMNFFFGRLVSARVRGRGRPKQKVATLYEQDIYEMATARLVSVSGHKTCSAGPTCWILA
jgi:hypothetical protein